LKFLGRPDLGLSTFIHKVLGYSLGALGWDDRWGGRELNGSLSSKSEIGFEMGELTISWDWSGGLRLRRAYGSERVLE
jgi:hypothetical protein